MYSYSCGTGTRIRIPTVLRLVHPDPVYDMNTHIFKGNVLTKLNMNRMRFLFARSAYSTQAWGPKGDHVVIYNRLSLRYAFACSTL
jgi:hypothetical protein